MAQSKASLILRQTLKARTRWQWRSLTFLATVGPVVFFLIAIFNLCVWRDTGRLYGMGAAINCLLALGTGMFLLRLLRRTCSITTAEDRAIWSYGASFERLNAIEKDRVKQQVRQEFRAKSRAPDEREAAMQRDAEGHAFRLFRRFLPGLLLVYWIVCLCLPIGSIRIGLLFSALALSGLTMVVLSLPELIRVWRMPKNAGEPHLVMGAPKEV